MFIAPSHQLYKFKSKKVPIRSVNHNRYLAETDTRVSVIIRINVLVASANVYRQQIEH